MSTKVIMPQMGESIFEGTITKWLKKVGEKVARDEPLFEISTDKVDSEIPAPAAGVLSEILVPEGKTVQINTVVAVIDGEGAATGKPEPKETAGEKAETSPAQEKKEVEKVKDEAVTEPPHRAEAGEKPAAPEPEDRPETTAAEKPKAPAAPAPPPLKPAAAPPPPKAAPPESARDIRTSPLVRKLAREHGIDLSRIQGTGLEGRITKQDILSLLDQSAEVEETPKPRLAEVPKPAPAPAAPAEKEVAQPAPAVPEAPKFTGESETVPMTPMRKAIAEHMVF